MPYAIATPNIWDICLESSLEVDAIWHLRSAFNFSRCRSEACCLDSGESAQFIFISSIAGNAYCADHVLLFIENQHTAGRGHCAPLTDGSQRTNKGGKLCGPFGNFTCTESHAERAPGFAVCNIETYDTGAVFAFEDH